MEREMLVAISNDARGWLDVWTRDFTDEELRDAGGTVLNPAAWHLGHLACVEDEAYELFTGEARIAPAALQAVCGSGCQPPGPDAEYPPLAELRDLLGRTHDRVLGLVAEGQDLDRAPLTENQFFKSTRQAVYELALHETYHVGMIAAVRKVLGKPRIG